MKSSELNATIITSDSTRSSNRKAIPSRARGVRLGLVEGARVASCPQRQRRAGDRRESRGIDQHRQLEPTGQEEKPPEQGAEAEAHVASGLDVGVRLLNAVAGELRHERELGGLEDREHQPQQRREGERGRRPGREAEHRGDEGAEQGDDGQQARGLDPVDEQPGVTRHGHRGDRTGTPRARPRPRRSRSCP
jgi:hypothetical protein